MSRKTYRVQKFISKTNKNYTIDEVFCDEDIEDESKYPKDENNETMELFFEQSHKDAGFYIGTKMTSSQIKIDRKKRNAEHFKKEVYPTLGKGSKEALHFKKKYNLKSL